MLKARHLRTLARAAADLGKTELSELVARIQAARLAQQRAEMRQLAFRIQADRAARHAEIHLLIDEFEEAHASRRHELDGLRVDVREELAEYAAANREAREEWQRQLVAIERARRGLEEQDSQGDETKPAPLEAAHAMPASATSLGGHAS